MNKELKRDRKKLGEVFIKNYNDKILKDFDIERFVFQLKDKRANKVALFCVEENQEACHRSLLGKKLFNTVKLPTLSTDL